MAVLAREGAAEALWIRAERQTGGRGRQSRIWQSPPGNLHASTLVRPLVSDPPPATLTLVAALALDELVAAHLGTADRLVIKWPNDVLLDGAKLAGILLERVDEAIVVGFGVNLAHHPSDLDRPTTSLAAVVGGLIDPEAFLIDLAQAFARWLSRWRSEGLPTVIRCWIARAHPLGTPLSIAGAGGGTIEGWFAGLASDGALRLRLADGSVHAMHAGDVSLI